MKRIVDSLVQRIFGVDQQPELFHLNHERLYDEFYHDQSSKYRDSFLVENLEIPVLSLTHKGPQTAMCKHPCYCMEGDSLEC